VSRRASRGAWPARAARAAALCLAVACLAASSGCGYALAGRGSFLPDYIRIVGIPIFVNNTAVFDAEQVLTTRVREEFISRGRYRVIPQAAGADGILTGEIASISLTPVGFNDNQQASRYAAQIVLKVTFRDVRADKVIWENPSLVYREEFDLVTVTGSGIVDASTFFGQGGNALDRLATDFARSVVTSILEAF
jgi:hypothetical protein